MEYRQIIQDTTNYPVSPYLTLPRFQDLNSNQNETEQLLLVFDSSFVQEHETVISLPEPQLLQVSFKHGFKSTGKVSCSRDCTYVFKFSEEIKVEDLVAQWTEDNFLIIKGRKQTLAEKLAEPAKDIHVESEIKRLVTSKEQGNIKLETSTTSSEIQSLPQNIKKSIVSENLEEPEAWVKSEGIPRLIPQRVNKIYKPNLSVMELKRVLNDIDSRMLFVKNVMDNHSFDASIKLSSDAQGETKSLQSQ